MFYMDFTVFLNLVYCQLYTVHDVTSRMSNVCGYLEWIIGQWPMFACSDFANLKPPLEEMILRENPFQCCPNILALDIVPLFQIQQEFLLIFYDAVNHLALAFSQSNHETLINKLDLVLESSQWTMLIDPCLVTWLIPFTKKLSW